MVLMPVHVFCALDYLFVFSVCYFVKMSCSTFVLIAWIFNQALVRVSALLDSLSHE